MNPEDWTKRRYEDDFPFYCLRISIYCLGSHALCGGYSLGDTEVAQCRPEKATRRRQRGEHGMTGYSAQHSGGNDIKFAIRLVDQREKLQQVEDVALHLQLI